VKGHCFTTKHHKIAVSAILQQIQQTRLTFCDDF